MADPKELARLIALAEADLARLWTDFDTPEQAREWLADVLPGLVALYGSAAATLAADWYDDLREQAGAKGNFRAIPAELPDQGRTDSLAGWAVGSMFGPDPNPTATLTLATGGLQRIVANASRQTITVSSIADPAARGWRRVGRGSSCEFCQMLLGRGDVYSEASADFASHDHCNCGAEPAFD